MYKILILMAFLVYGMSAYGQRGTSIRPSECRIALVIGNSNYNGRDLSTLSNPGRDADSLKAVLTYLKFKVFLHKNVSQNSFKTALIEFEAEISSCKKQGKRVVALLYYAGHGVRWRTDEQLISVEAKNLNDTTAYIGLDKLIIRLNAVQSDLKIFILDACRETVYSSFKHYTIPPPSAQPAVGTFIAYATGINQVAKDGDSLNSPYTSALLKEIRKPNIPIAQTFENIKNQIASTQQTAAYDELIGKFCFNPIEESVSTDTLMTNHSYFQDHFNTVRCISFSKNEQYLITGGWDHRLLCYNWRDKKIRYDIRNGPHDDKVTSVTICPNDRYFVTTSTDSMTKLYSLSDGRLVHTWSDHQGIMMTAQFSPDGTYLATAGKDNVIYVYRMSDYGLEHLFEEHTDAIHQIRFSPDGKYLATASLDKTVRLYNMTDFSLSHTFLNHTEGVNVVTFSPKGTYLVTAGRDKKIHLYRMSDKRLLYTFPHHTETIYSIGFSSDSRLMASAGEDKKVHIYEFNTRKLIQTLTDHTDWIYQISFSPNGRYLATASKDSTFRLYQH
jgi:WD40 repeat protein